MSLHRIVPPHIVKSSFFVLQFGSQYRRALGTYQRVEVPAVKDGKKGPYRGPVLPPLLRPSTYAWVAYREGKSDTACVKSHQAFRFSVGLYEGGGFISLKSTCKGCRAH